MADFNKAHQFVVDREGGYQNHPDDTGNYTSDGTLIGTNWGISADTLSTYLGRTATESEMKNLSFDLAMEIYRDGYWNKINGDDIENQSVALLIYDGSVNHGRGAMRQVVGSAMRDLDVSIEDEVVFEKAGIDKLNKKNQEKLFNLIWKGREARYLAGQDVFKEGHLDRISKIKFSKGGMPLWAKIGISMAIVSVVALSIYGIAKVSKTKRINTIE